MHDVVRGLRLHVGKATTIGIVTLMLLTLLGGALVYADDSPGGSKAGEVERKSLEETAGSTPLTQFPNVWGAASQYMSGRNWLIFSGQDPTFDPQARLEGRSIEAPSVSNSIAFTSPALPPQGPASQGVGGGLVPFRDPAPAFSRNLLVTRDFGVPFQTEPHLAVNPSDPDHLVLSVVDYNFPSNSSYVSIDGGENWEGPFQNRYIRDDLGAAGDPVVAFDRDGNVYSIGISIGFEEFAIGPFVAFINVSSIYAAKSEDGGFNWQEPVDTARSGVPPPNLEPDEEGRPRGEVTISFLDKPWIAIGPNPDDPSKDNMYITYTDFEQIFQIFYIGEQPILGTPRLQTTIRLVHSEDNGRTWSEPVDVSPTVLLEFGERGSGSGEASTARRRIVQGSQPQVANDGTVYVNWLDTTDDDSQEGLGEIYVARSTDGGRNFQDSVLTSTFKELNFTPRTNRFRYWGSVFPQLALGPDEQVYIAYVALPPEKALDDGDVYVVSSTDGGATFERPVRINGDDTNRLQMFPSIATSPNGDIHLMWGDMRDDPAEARYHIYYSTSTDEGKTWGFDLEEFDIHTPDTRVTDFPTNPNRAFPGGAFIGDYFSLAASDEDVYMVWPDGRLGEFGPQNQKIAFARKRQIRSPEVFISPPAGPGGETITIQGFNFQPDLTYFIRVGGVTVQAARTDQQGQLTAQIFVPISGEGSHNIDVFDDSGNFATASFFMEFGFDNIKERQEEILDRLDALSAIAPPVSDGSNGGGSSNGTANAPLDDDDDGAPMDAVSIGIVGAIGGATGVGLLLAIRRRKPDGTASEA